MDSIVTRALTTTELARGNVERLITGQWRLTPQFEHQHGRALRGINP
jgi:hypothetical protein